MNEWKANRKRLGLVGLLLTSMISCAFVGCSKQAGGDNAGDSAATPVPPNSLELKFLYSWGRLSKVPGS